MPSTLVSVPEYLGTTYRPDREYVDGQVLERNMGEWDHSRLQALLFKHLLPYEETHGLIVVPEQRVQVGHRVFASQTYAWFAATQGSRS